MKKSVLILLLLLCYQAFAQQNTLFEEGNSFYNKGHYIEAIEKYEAVLATEEHSASLYYNLGNAYYKLNKIAPSIYYYEKALQLDPNDSDIKNNLAFANNMTVDAISVLPEVGFSKFVNDLIKRLDYEHWAWVAVLSSFVFVLAFIAYYFGLRSGFKRYFFISSCIALACMLLSLLFAFRQKTISENDKPAIVFASEAQVQVEPNLRSEQAFLLHEGTKVQIIETFGDWSKIQIADGTNGWISSEEIKAL